MASFLVTGGSGFIGSALVTDLVDAGHEVMVISRKPEKHAGKFGESVRYIRTFAEIDPGTNFQAIINLGGEGIGDKRWSKQRKQVLLDSRICLTDQLVQFLQRLETKPQVMISGSAIGWYGAQDDKPLSEEAAFNPEFSHELCQQWEEAASAVKSMGVRLCVIRLGIVLGNKGGVLKRMLPPFQFGLGGRIGSGQQMMSWIHMSDVIKGIKFLLDKNALEGVFNLTAPHAATNSEFTKLLGKALHRPAFLPLPAVMVKLLFGEMGDRLLLKGQNVVPARLLDSGYTFEYATLDVALSAIFPR